MKAATFAKHEHDFKFYIRLGSVKHLGRYPSGIFYLEDLPFVADVRLSLKGFVRLASTDDKAIIGSSTAGRAYQAGRFSIVPGAEKVLAFWRTKLYSYK